MNATVELARRVGQKLVALVPENIQRAFDFSSRLPSRPPLDQVLRQATSDKERLTNLSNDIRRAAANDGQLQDMAPKVEDAFSSVRQTWRLMRQTPVSELMANRQAVETQVSQLQAAVEKAYTQTAQAYLPTEPAWKAAGKALLMSHLSVFHVHARIAAANYLGSHNVMANAS